MRYAWDKTRSFSYLGSGDKKSSENEQSFSDLFYFNISRKNIKTSKVNEQSVLNLILKSGQDTLKNTQTEPQKYF